MHLRRWEKVLLNYIAMVGGVFVAVALDDMLHTAAPVAMLGYLWGVTYQTRTRWLDI